MKAIAPILTHALFLAFGTFVLIFVCLSVFNLRASSEQETAKATLKIITGQVSDKILDLYIVGSSSSSTGLVASAELNLPARVADKDYILKLENKNIIAEIPTLDLVVNSTINIEINMEGSGKKALEYWKNGEDKIILVSK